MEALPEIYDDLIDRTSNLAGDPCSDPLGNLAALMATNYMTADGSPIGRGNDCRQMTMGMNDGLRGLGDDRLLLPPIFEENRIEFGERWAFPLVVGVSNWFLHRRVARAGLWTLAAYMAPLPVAAALATMIGVGATRAERAGDLGEGGEGYGVRQEYPARRRICCAKYAFVRTHAGRPAKRCIKFRRC